MARKTPEESQDSPADWADQTPCEECGGRPGYNPATGLELRGGHWSGCSHWKESA